MKICCKKNENVNMSSFNLGAQLEHLSCVWIKYVDAFFNIKKL